MEEYTDKVMENGKGDIEAFINVRHPAYINNNVYLNGAKHFDREKDFYVSEYDCGVRVFEENGVIYLDINVPDNISLENADVINTHSLPIPRISEMPFEDSNGNAIILNEDIKGNMRMDKPKAGALEEIKTGKQRISLYTANKSVKPACITGVSGNVINKIFTEL